MPIVITPEVGIPLPIDTTPEEIESFRGNAHALFKTVEKLAQHGLNIDITAKDKELSRSALTEMVLPTKTPTPGAILHLEALLSEWDHELLDTGRRLRAYITNKLLAETEDPDPRIRIKALELLGKITEVGLFSEQIGVTVNHRSIGDIESELKKTLELFSGRVIDLEVVQKTQAVADIDVDKEFGLAQ